MRVITAKLVVTKHTVQQSQVARTNGHLLFLSKINFTSSRLQSFMKVSGFKTFLPTTSRGKVYPCLCMCLHLRKRLAFYQKAGQGNNYYLLDYEHRRGRGRRRPALLVICFLKEKKKRLHPAMYLPVVITYLHFKLEHDRILPIYILITIHIMIFTWIVILAHS